jgi:hypothetical protein
MTKQPVSGPTLISPENNSRLTSLDAIFSWARIENVPYYELIVSKFSDFRNSVSNSRSLTNTYYVIVGLDYSTIYYWKVRAVNGTENGDWSQVFNFTTMSSIKGPSLINPGKSSYGIGTSALFSWQPLNDVMGYDLQLSTDQNFTSILSNFVGISGTSQTVNYLPSSSTLWWRVRGWKNADIGEWSEGWSFKTASSSLSTPLVIYPQDQRTNVSVNGILRWGAVSGATSYEVILSDKPDLSNVLGFYIGLATPSLSLSDLAFSQTYYWRVLARKDNETSPWTPVFSFTTHSSSVGVKEVDDIAKSYSLSQNYPNPFNPSTNITYSIMEPSLVTIKIYDIYGREVETLVNQFHSSGKYVTTWEPKNIPTGVYYYQIHAGKYNEVRKMVYIR